MKFLAVSQDKSVINLLCSEFKNQGYETYGVGSLNELIQLQNKEKYDVVVSDHLLPDGNFFDYYDKLKLLEKQEVPAAIVLTNPEEKFVPEVAFAMGAFAVFQKPFNLRDMYDAVENATYSRREGLTRRMDERVHLICRLEFRLRDSNQWHFAFSNNISFGGFFAVVSEDIPNLKSEIDFVLKFGEKQMIEGVGRVVWSRKIPKKGEQMGFGVQFMEGREKYVKLLVPIINEARTRQIEASVFQEENMVSILEQSLHLAKVKVAKSKTKFIFQDHPLESLIICRLPKILRALSELLFHIALPLHDVNESQCELKVEKKPGKVVVKIVAHPGGTSLDTQEVLEKVVQPILQAHQAKIKCTFSSDESLYLLSFPAAK